MTPKIRVYCVLIAALIMTGGSHATASIQLNLGDTVQATLTQSASIMGTGNTSFALYNTTLRASRRPGIQARAVCWVGRT